MRKAHRQYIYIYVYLYIEFAYAQGLGSRIRIRRQKEMRKIYLVCNGCRQSWIWEERLLHQPSMACNLCGKQWKKQPLPDLRRKRVEWAPWNFTQKGEQWPKRSFKEALVTPPPGLYGGKPPKKNKAMGIEKKLQEHRATIPETLRAQVEAMGVKAAEPTPPPDLPTLIKDHLQSLPTELRHAVERSTRS